jgi:hypothetical protein
MKETHHAPPGTQCSICSNTATTGWLLPEERDGFPACDGCIDESFDGDVWALLGKIRQDAKRVEWIVTVASA